MKVFLAILLLSAVVLAASAATTPRPSKVKNCYQSATKCVPSEKSINGIIWKDCAEFCRKCRGKDVGECAVSATVTCKGFYCKCSGKRVDKTESLQEAASCRLGL